MMVESHGVPDFVSEKVMVILVWQLSVAAACPVADGAVLLLQATETLAGQAIKGATLSFLVMV